ncbi:RES family NAD+ phosphorylase [Spirosoma validum]|uniref:RES family NAD+ phosphorylase n=1 Tax=Spirosoma validum TaxID=2771355 RepID=A0A927B4H4_9BACT|nr:RES family NAD+ phosphorylase [Spirosoma validum]MBD2755234.1 RES family NAD+ phosphorylase [Spirosoma validum]
MELFRITRSKYVADLSGKGAYERGGRWNSTGQFALYTAQSRSLAMVESLVYLSNLPPEDEYKIAVLYLPDSTFVQTVDIQQLKSNWRNDQKYTRQFGDEWLKNKASLLLRVPSVIVKAEYNYVVNPQHELFSRLKLVDIEPFTFDGRLFNK